MFMTIWKLILLYCHGHQRFHSLEHSDFPAYAVKDVPLTTEYPFLCPTMLPYKQGDHVFNIIFFLTYPLTTY